MRYESAIFASPRAAFLLTLALLWFASPARGQQATAAATTTPPTDDDWVVLIAPYFWGSGLQGTLEDNGFEAEFDIDFVDIFEALDFAGLAAVEVRHRRLMLESNLIYLDLSPEAGRATGSVLPSAPPGSFGVRADVQELLLEVLAGYEVVRVGQATDVRWLALDLTGGLRYTWLESSIRVELDPGAPLGPFRRDAREREGWADILVGARVRAHFTEKLGLTLGGNVGGFDIGSASELTWSVVGLMTYRLGDRWTLAGGWRVLDFERGFADVRMSGPLLGAVYAF